MQQRRWRNLLRGRVHATRATARRRRGRYNARLEGKLGSLVAKRCAVLSVVAIRLTIRPISAYVTVSLSVNVGRTAVTINAHAPAAPPPSLIVPRLLIWSRLVRRSVTSFARSGRINIQRLRVVRGVRRFCGSSGTLLLPNVHDVIMS